MSAPGSIRTTRRAVEGTAVACYAEGITADESSAVKRFSQTEQTTAKAIAMHPRPLDHAAPGTRRHGGT